MKSTINRTSPQNGTDSELSRAVRQYWEQNPLGSLEFPAEESASYLRSHETVRWEDEGIFVEHLYGFKEAAGMRVLDIGCGVGWIVSNFARRGANVTGMDLTYKALEFTRKRLMLFGGEASLIQADAEKLPFPDGSFDVVVSAGVLHHTPATYTAVHEALRVLAPGGRAMISLYYRHPMLSRTLWPATRLAIRIAFRLIPGREGFANASSAEELVRMYDGNDNPLGRMYSKKEMRELFKPYDITKLETHYFPFRFLRGVKLPMAVKRVLDRLFGTMVYAVVQK